jgi:hypothetical protein
MGSCLSHILTPNRERSRNSHGPRSHPYRPDPQGRDSPVPTPTAIDQIRSTDVTSRQNTGPNQNRDYGRSDLSETSPLLGNQRTNRTRTLDPETGSSRNSNARGYERSSTASNKTLIRIYLREALTAFRASALANYLYPRADYLRVHWRDVVIGLADTRQIWLEGDMNTQVLEEVWCSETQNVIKFLSSGGDEMFHERCVTPL